MPNLQKRLRDLRYKLFYGLLLSRRFDLVTLGAADSICQWTIGPKGLGPRSIIYSAGVGSDITFEHALVETFGCEVILIDPSPTGLKTMGLPQNKIPQFHFLPVALAARNGKLKLSPPLDAEGDSWFGQPDAPGGIEVTCADLGSLMKQNKHSHIDLLKLDIEGCEYEVIEDILRKRLPISQIAVEFHHGILPGFDRGQTIRTMLKLIRHGYRLADQTGANHTFISPGLSAGIEDRR
jgi:FkbM family methyltransferase